MAGTIVVRRGGAHVSWAPSRSGDGDRGKPGALGVQLTWFLAAVLGASVAGHALVQPFLGETVDPDGYLIRLWDERSMKEK
jgi:hypothetical protein